MPSVPSLSPRPSLDSLRATSGASTPTRADKPAISQPGARAARPGGPTSERVASPGAGRSGRVSPALLADASPRATASASTTTPAPAGFDPVQSEAVRQQCAQVNAFLDGTPQGQMILAARDNHFADMDPVQADKLRELLVLAGRMQPAEPPLAKGSVAPREALAALDKADAFLAQARAHVESRPASVAEALTGDGASSKAARLKQVLDIAHELARQLAAVEPRQLAPADAQALMHGAQAWRDHASSLLESARASGDAAVVDLAQRVSTSADFANNDMLMGLAEAKMGAAHFAQAYGQALGDEIDKPYARAAAQRMNQGRDA